MPVSKGETPPQPWALGAHHVVVARKVGEDEHISIEFYAKTQEIAETWVEKYLATLRDHMVKYNKQVVLAMTKQLRLIEEKIEDRGEVLREIERKIEAHERDAAVKPNGPVPVEAE
jgi:predicted RNA-binding protein with PIN domain